ncbi:Protein BTG1 [Lemmus lemmus]
MRGEIYAAAEFISNFLSIKGLRSKKLRIFRQTLQELLAAQYKHHWFPEEPCKGSGYRCIRINHNMDPLIGQAAERIGLSSEELFRFLPCELTLWVDPYEVSYRIGEDGSICVLYESLPKGNGFRNITKPQMLYGRMYYSEEVLWQTPIPFQTYNMMTVWGQGIVGTVYGWIIF